MASLWRNFCFSEPNRPKSSPSCPSCPRRRRNLSWAVRDWAMSTAPFIGNKMAAAQIGSAFSRIKSAPRQIRYVREILSARNRREHVNLVAILKTRTKFNARSIAENGKVSPDAWSSVAEPAFHNGPSSIKGGDQACDRIRRYSDLRLRFRKKRKESPWKNNLDLGTVPLCAIKFLSFAIMAQGRVFLPERSEVNCL